MELKYTIDNKPKIKINDEEIVDLLHQNFKSFNFNIKDVVLCHSDFKMRMDLISFVKFGSTEYTDLLLKVNDISNPFSLDENDVILIPNIDKINEYLEKPEKTNVVNYKEKIKEQYSKLKERIKIKNKGDDLKEYENMTSIPPNYNVNENEKELIIKNGEIILAPNYKKSDENEKNIPLSKILLKNSLKNKNE